MAVLFNAIYAETVAMVEAEPEKSTTGAPIMNLFVQQWPSSLIQKALISKTFSSLVT